MTEILGEGWVKKCSRHLKKWRDRWLVLTNQGLFTYKTEGGQRHGHPTERIRVSEILGITSGSNKGQAYCFQIRTKNRIFKFSANDIEHQEAWIRIIGRGAVRPTALRSKSEEDALEAMGY